MSQSAANFNWSELSPAEIATRLRRLCLEHGASSTCFLDIQSWGPLQKERDLRCSGGHPLAQMRIVSTGEAEAPRMFELPRSGSLANTRSVRQLRADFDQHGLQRSLVGDVVLGERIVLALHPAADTALLPADALPLAEWPASTVPVQRFSAAAQRSDAVSASLFHVSREEAQVALRQGYVWRNLERVSKAAAPVNAGDSLHFGTRGRAEILELEKNTRSGRLWVSARIYPL